MRLSRIPSCSSSSSVSRYSLSPKEEPESASNLLSVSGEFAEESSVITFHVFLSVYTSPVSASTEIYDFSGVYTR